MGGKLGDERAFKAALREATADVGQEELEDAIRQAAEYANDAFRRAAADPPEGASLDEWNLEPIVESVEFYTERGESQGKLQQGDAFVAEWTHPHTDKMEVGVRPHEIEGSPILRWTDRETGDVIYAQKVDHPGNPGIGAIREGFRKILEERYL